jgi:hypothetical protein
MALISLNRDPKLNDFSKEDFVLNTITGDLFVKTDNKLFKIVGRNQFDETTTDNILKLLSAALNFGDGFSGFNTTDGFYGIISTDGDNVSIHGGNSFTSPSYIKTPGSFEILLDSGNGSTSETFKIYTNSGLGGVYPSVELLSLNESGLLQISGGLGTIEGKMDGGSF